MPKLHPIPHFFSKLQPGIRSGVAALAALLLFSILLSLVYRLDNKYTAGPPYGENGVFAFTESDLTRPLHLIDGWLLDGQEVFIGQYSNFSYLPGRNSPFGTGTYSLTLRYDGAPRTLLLEIPTIFTQYTLYINGAPIATEQSGTQAAVPVGGDTLLTLQTENHTHYYSGLTYPPALGTPEVMGRLFFLRTLCYSAVCFSALTLALFSMVLWLSRTRNIQDAPFLHFGLLCVAFALYCAHALIRQLGGTGGLWYVLADTAWLFVLAQMAHLTALAARLEHLKWYRALRPILLLVCPLAAGCTLFLLPAFGGLISWYGAFIDGYKIAVWAFLAFTAGVGLCRGEKGSAPLLLGASAILGASVLTDVWDSNHFEPIYFLWQNEYAGVLLVLLFGGMMVRRNRSLLRQSQELRALSLQYRYAAESAAQMRQSAKLVRAMKHELNHHIEALSALSVQGDYARLGSYLTELRGEKNALPPLLYCDHFIINAVLCCYLAPLQSQGVRVDYRVQVPEELPLPDAELCTLLSNLLQNAAEAVTGPRITGEPFLSLELVFRENLFSFSLRNSAPPGENRGGFPTTKPDRENHGFGLSAITQMAKKRHGAVNAVQTGGSFTVRGVLSLPPEPADGPG